MSSESGFLLEKNFRGTKENRPLSFKQKVIVLHRSFFPLTLFQIGGGGADSALF